MIGNGALTFTPDSGVTPTALSQPHHIYSSTYGGTTSNGYQYDLDGGLKARPDTDGAGTANPDTARSITYDPEGRVASITAGSNTVQSIYDYSGARVARVVGTTATLYFGNLFEITGTSLTRHIFAGKRRIAQSTVTRTAALASAEGFEGRLLALASAAPGMAAVLLLPLIVLIPGRIRISFSTGRQAPLRWMRQGHLLLLVTVCATVPCRQAAMAVTITGNTRNLSMTVRHSRS